MDFRHTMKGRRALSAVAITTGLLLTVAGCGGGSGDGNGDKGSSSSSAPAKRSGDGGSSEQDKALAEVKGGDVTLTITSAVRDQGGFVTVNGEVTNNGGEFWIPTSWRGDERELSRNGASLAGASLVDSSGRKKYLVLRDTTGRCLCTKFDGGGVDPGKSADWFAQFPAPPDGTTKVDFQVGDMPPASIEISGGE